MGTEEGAYRELVRQYANAATMGALVCTGTSTDRRMHTGGQHNDRNPRIAACMRPEVGRWCVRPSLEARQKCGSPLPDARSPTLAKGGMSRPPIRCLGSSASRDATPVLGSALRAHPHLLLSELLKSEWKGGPTLSFCSVRMR